MGKTGKRVRAPRVPKGEPAKVTIANLERHIRDLIKRCETVVRERDEARADAATAYAQRNQLLPMQEAHTRLQGWQDCARELLELERTHIRIDRVKDSPF